MPAWQFHPEARRGRLDGIDAVVAAFPGGVLWLSSWIVTPSPMLDGSTPRDALLRGRLPAVVAAAGSVGA